MKSRPLIACAAMTWAATLAPAIVTAQRGAAGGGATAEARETLARVCSDCHGLDTIEGQRRTRAQWQYVVDDMLSRGAQASDDEAKTIVDYLAQSLGRVNVNRASEDDMRSVLELPPAEAAAIVEYRTRQGEFKTLDDLKKVPGLDFGKVDGKQDRIAFAGQ